MINNNKKKYYTAANRDYVSEINDEETMKDFLDKTTKQIMRMPSLAYHFAHLMHRVWKELCAQLMYKYKYIARHISYYGAHPTKDYSYRSKQNRKKGKSLLLYRTQSCLTCIKANASFSVPFVFDPR